MSVSSQPLVPEATPPPAYTNFDTHHLEFLTICALDPELQAAARQELNRRAQNQETVSGPVPSEA